MEILILGIVILVIIGIPFSSFFRVEPDTYANLNWKFFLSDPTPEGHFIAIDNQQGIRATVYNPGVHFIFLVKLSFFGEIIPHPIVSIPENQLGLVIAKDGKALEKGYLYTRKFPKCNNFADAEAFLKSGGEKGPQIELLLSGSDNIINEEQFEVKKIDLTIVPGESFTHPQTGEKFDRPTLIVGIVTVKVGNPIPENEGRVIARDVSGHNNFQDLKGFIEPLPKNFEKLSEDKKQIILSKKLEAGPQRSVLESGIACKINTTYIDVEFHPVPYIPPGSVGVIVSNVGIKPNDKEIEILRKKNKDEISDSDIDKVDKYIYILDPSKSIKERSGDPKGNGYKTKNRIGILPETLGPGFTPFRFANPVAYQIFILNTTPVRVRWTDKPLQTKKNGIKYIEYIEEPMQIRTSNGFVVFIKGEVIIRVSRGNAPKVLALAGGIPELINDIVIPVTGDIVGRIFSGIHIDRLLDERADIIKKITKGLEENLCNKTIKDSEKNYYISVDFRITDFDFDRVPETKHYIDLRTQAINAEKEVILNVELAKVEESRILVENKRAEANNQALLVEGDFQKRASIDFKEAIKNLGEGFEGIEAGEGAAVIPQALKVMFSSPKFTDFLKSAFGGVTIDDLLSNPDLINNIMKKLPIDIKAVKK